MNKKIIVMLLALCLMLALCACKADTPAAPTTSTAPAAQGGVEDNTVDWEQSGDDKSFTASIPIENDPNGNEASSDTSENAATDSTVTGTTENTGAEVSKPNTDLTYEEFMAMSAAEKRKHQESFPDMEQFFDWYDAAKAQYDKDHPSIEIGGNGTVTLPT